MEITSKLKRLHDETLASIGRAAGRGITDEVIRLGRVAEQCRTALKKLQDLEAEVAAIEARLREAPGTGTNSLEGAPSVESSASVPGKLSPRARAKQGRSAFLGKLRSQGIQLRQLDELVFQTTSGKKVGMPYATELEDLPDRWFLGLPDERFDIVVLLCQDGSGLHEFVFPSGFVSQIWHSLSRGKHGVKRGVKFNILRNGPNFELRLIGGVLKQINQFLGKVDVLV